MTKKEALLQSKSPKNVDHAYANLASAIVLQAIKDLEHPCSAHDYYSALAFFSTEWANLLTLGHLDELVENLENRGVHING